MTVNPLTRIWAALENAGCWFVVFFVSLETIPVLRAFGVDPESMLMYFFALMTIYSGVVFVAFVIEVIIRAMFWRIDD